MSLPVSSHILPTYARADLVFDRGEGVWLLTEDGDRYLDFGGGIAVASLGYSHPHLVEALRQQGGKLWHTSNLYKIPGGERLADRLVEATFADLVFFTNSGAEANEAAIKMARKYQSASGHPERFRIVTFEGAFHGRTLATIAAGGQQKYIDGFGPKVDGFDQVPFDDWAALEAAIGPETGAVMIEPIQGEGGVRVVSRERLKALRALCDDKGLLLIFDEVQTGVGRTGTFFAHERAGVTPDIMSIAKGIGGGFPMGACLATREAAKGMTTGSHGTTFGGNPLAMSVGNAVLDVVLAPGFFERVGQAGLLLKQSLAELQDRHPGVIAEIRGDGLMLGLRTVVPNGEFVAAARARHLLVIAAGDNVVRLLPPLVVTDAEIGDAFDRLDAACADIEAKGARFGRHGASRHLGGAGRCIMTGSPASRRGISSISTPFRASELRRILDGAVAIKGRRRAASEAAQPKPLAGRTLAMIFDQPSTRTRVSFEVGMRELGGECVMLTGAEMQLGRGETIADTAKVLSRYVDAIMIRTLEKDLVEELAHHATIPVINGLTKASHPCQVMADVMTFEEHRGPIAGRVVAWSGDSNNVMTSWVHAAQRFGFEMRVASPAELAPARICSTGRAVTAPSSSSRGPARGRAGRGCGRVRLLGLDGRRREHEPPQPSRALSGQCAADGRGRSEGPVHALPSGASRRRGDRRGDRRPAIRRLRRGREPPACAEGDPGLVPRSPGMRTGGLERPVSDLGHDDLVLPFSVAPLDIRGRVVRLGPSIDHILTQHGYPDAVSRLVGEAAALTALLGRP